MRRIRWIALATATMWVGLHAARADEPTPRPDLPQAVPSQIPPSVEAAPPTTPEPVPAPAAAEPTAPEAGSAGPVVDGSSDRCPSCGGPMGSGDCGCCSNCGHRQIRVARALDWLFYRPADHGKAKCCQTCMSCPPPAWAFFPCQSGGRCNSCVAGGAIAIAVRPAEAPAAGQVVKSAYPSPPAAQLIPQVAAPVAPKPATPSARLSSYAPQAVSQTMPILDPTQFRKQ